jgi:hypothetical protein
MTTIDIVLLAAFNDTEISGLIKQYLKRIQNPEYDFILTVVTIQTYVDRVSFLRPDIFICSGDVFKSEKDAIKKVVADLPDCWFAVLSLIPAYLEFATQNGVKHTIDGNSEILEAKLLRFLDSYLECKDKDREAGFSN